MPSCPEWADTPRGALLAAATPAADVAALPPLPPLASSPPKPVAPTPFADWAAMSLPAFEAVAAGAGGDANNAHRLAGDATAAAAAPVPLKTKRTLASVLPPSAADAEEGACAHVTKERRASAPEPLPDCAAAAAAAAAVLPRISEGAAVADADSAAAAAAAMDLDALLAAAAVKPGYCDPNNAAGAAPAAATAALGLSGAAGALAASPALAAVLSQYGAASIPTGCAVGIGAAAADHVAATATAETFYVYDLGEVVRLHATWCAAMPRVHPFYAVKCNPEPAVMATLDALGAGFDCASVQELERAAALGVPQSRVIFANPCKRPADLRYAARTGVAVTTFDCVGELAKIAAGCPSMECVLRIRCDDADAKINLGLKYGADLADVPGLLDAARALGLQVVGVSFHVGSGCRNVLVYADAIAAARSAWDAATAAGFAMRLLDLGGGFTAPHSPDTATLFYDTASVINAALAEHFPPGCGARIIAEPGRYFAETSATLFTSILGHRATPPGSPERSGGGGGGGAQGQSAGNGEAGGGEEGGPFMDYWLSDGTYGSFRIQVTVDGLEPWLAPRVVRSPLLAPPTLAEDAPTACRLWGNSVRQTDCVQARTRLPRLRDGDWLQFTLAGAYTVCAASNYCGVQMATPDRVYVFSAAAAAVRDGGAA